MQAISDPYYRSACLYPTLSATVSVRGVDRLSIAAQLSLRLASERARSPTGSFLGGDVGMTGTCGFGRPHLLQKFAEMITLIREIYSYES